MLTTKDIQLGGSGKTSKSIKPGNINAKINEITLQPLKSDPNSCYLILHLEGEDLGSDFEGFMYDKDKPNLGRAKGQVGKVRYSPYPHKDGVSRAGKPRVKADEILRSLTELSEVAGKRNQLNEIEATTIEDFVKQASRILSGGQFYHWCIGGSAYLKDDGYKEFSLSLAKNEKGFRAYETVDTFPSKVMVFDYAKHVEDKTEAQTAESAPWGTPTTPSTKEDTGWKPASFNLD